jgi:hypothetical protein
MRNSPILSANSGIRDHWDKCDCRNDRGLACERQESSQPCAFSSRLRVCFPADHCLPGQRIIVISCSVSTQYSQLGPLNPSNYVACWTNLHQDFAHLVWEASPDSCALHCMQRCNRDRSVLSERLEYQVPGCCKDRHASFRYPGQLTHHILHFVNLKTS